jgi:hypothetical protein
MVGQTQIPNLELDRLPEITLAYDDIREMARRPSVIPFFQ